MSLESPGHPKELTPAQTIATSLAIAGMLLGGAMHQVQANNQDPPVTIEFGEPIPDAKIPGSLVVAGESDSPSQADVHTLAAILQEVWLSKRLPISPENVEYLLAADDPISVPEELVHRFNALGPEGKAVLHERMVSFIARQNGPTFLTFVGHGGTINQWPDAGDFNMRFKASTGQSESIVLDTTFIASTISEGILARITSGQPIEPVFLIFESCQTGSNITTVSASSEPAPRVINNTAHSILAKVFSDLQRYGLEDQIPVIEIITPVSGRFDTVGSPTYESFMAHFERTILRGGSITKVVYDWPAVSEEEHPQAIQAIHGRPRYPHLSPDIPGDPTFSLQRADSTIHATVVMQDPTASSLHAYFPGTITNSSSEPLTQTVVVADSSDHAVLPPQSVIGSFGVPPLSSVPFTTTVRLDSTEPLTATFHVVDSSGNTLITGIDTRAPRPAAHVYFDESDILEEHDRITVPLEVDGPQDLLIVVTDPRDRDRSYLYRVAVDEFADNRYVLNLNFPALASWYQEGGASVFVSVYDAAGDVALGENAQPRFQEEIRFRDMNNTFEEAMDHPVHANTIVTGTTRSNNDPDIIAFSSDVKAVTFVNTGESPLMVYSHVWKPGGIPVSDFIGIIDPKAGRLILIDTIPEGALGYIELYSATYQSGTYQMHMNGELVHLPSIISGDKGN